MNQAAEEASHPASSGGDRPILERVTTSVGAEKSWVKIEIRWPDGRITQSARYIGARKADRARSAAAALITALEERFEGQGVSIEIDDLLIHKLGGPESVVVRAAFSEAGKTTLVAGTAIVQDDICNAAVRAVLHAVNRSLVLCWRTRHQVAANA